MDGDDTESLCKNKVHLRSYRVFVVVGRGQQVGEVFIPRPPVTYALRAINNTVAAADNNPAQQRLKIRLPRGSANQRRICRPM